MLVALDHQHVYFMTCVKSGAWVSPRPYEFVFVLVLCLPHSRSSPLHPSPSLQVTDRNPGSLISSFPSLVSRQHHVHFEL